MYQQDKWLSQVLNRRRKEDRIRTILARTPYTPDSALYIQTKKEMLALLSDDAVYLISLAR